MIKINQDRCIECMTCVMVCPFTVLEEKDGRPQMAPGKGCLHCMHCGAACPTEAILFEDKPTILEGDLPMIGGEFHQELKNHILTRRSYRNFSQEPVPRGLIEETLDLASWAPSARNQHPTKWIIVDSKEVIDQMMERILENMEKTGKGLEIVEEYRLGKNIVMGTAPTLLLAYAPDDAISPETDTAIAMTTAELYLQAKGVGTCWAGYLKRIANDIGEVRALLPEIPEGHSFYGAFMLGYPENEKYIHVPQRVKRADIQWV